MFKRALLVIILFALAAPVAAQDGVPEPERVEIEASDDLVLVGNYFAQPEPADETGAPAVLLLHMLGSRKEAWLDLIPALWEGGYAVLAIDMRGHGETRGRQDWALAEADVQLWLDWLRTQPGVNPERLNLVGGSIGANMALRGMANDPRVVTAVALSPGLYFQDVTVEDAIQTIADRPVYLVAGQGDGPSSDAVRTLIGLATGDVLARIYPHSAHGTGIFMLESDLAPSIVAWLDAHN